MKISNAVVGLSVRGTGYGVRGMGYIRSLTHVAERAETLGDLRGQLIDIHRDAAPDEVERGHAGGATAVGD